jgi:hypothetical protein
MLRGFTDSTGVEWRVWEVFPTKGLEETGATAHSHSSLTNTAFANGWLCFESTAEKRRLAPIPAGWEFREPNVLVQLLDSATIVPLRRHGRGISGAA